MAQGQYQGSMATGTSAAADSAEAPSGQRKPPQEHGVPELQ